MAQLVKTVQGLAIASVKTVQGLAIASCKTIQGVDNTSSGGTIALVSNTSAGGTSTTVTTGSIDTTGANFIVVAIGSYNGATASTLSDSKGNTWTARTAYTDVGQGGASRIQIFYCAGATVGTGHTFTASSPGSGSYPCVAVAAFSNVGATPYASENGANSGTGTVQPGTVTPGSDNNLVIEAFANNNDGSTVSINAPFTISNQTAASSGNYVSVAMAYEIQTTATARNPTWTLSAGTVCVASAAVFTP